MTRTRKPGIRPHSAPAALPVILALILPLLAGGCAVWDFISVRYQNVTGYFNTYYNAVSLFNEAVAELEKEEENRDPKFDAPSPFILNIPPTVLPKFDKVIEKCSRILNFYEKSKWVDNALLLIGKSYYYKQELGRAERKFKELIQSFPESDLVAEAQLWLGKTWFMMERDDDAYKMVNTALQTATAAGQGKVVAEAWFTLGDMSMFLHKQEETIDEYKKGVASSTDTQKNARIQFALAKLEETLGNKENARKAYRKVLDFHPNDKLKFNAELQYVRLARELGDLDAAFKTLVVMLETPRYQEFEAQIQLQIAHTLAASKDVKNAIEQYRWVDTTYRGKPEAAEGYYSVARLYEYEMKDYDNAQENYAKAKMEFPGSEFARKGGKRADELEEYHRLRNKMYDLDTLYFFVQNPDSLARRDSLKVIRDSLDLAEKLRNGYDPMAESRESSQRQSRRPHGRNTGKITALPFGPAPDQVVRAGQSMGSTAVIKKDGSYHAADLRRMKPDSVARQIGRLRFEMGTVMYLKLQNRDSARYYFERALKAKIEDEDAARAMFMLAQMRREDGDSLGAVAMEDSILAAYPKTPIGFRLRMNRGIPIPPDSTELALDAYNRAAAHLEAGRDKQGIEEMQLVIRRFPFSEQAVRARLAIGMTYELALADKDSMLKVYSGIAQDFPNSIYARRPREILQAMADLEKERKEGAAPKQPPPNGLPEQKDPAMPTPMTPPPLPADTTAVKKPPVKLDPTHDPDFPLNPTGNPGVRKKDIR